MSDKRTDYLSWDEYFMGIAVLSSLRSKDPHTQVGACIVNQDKRIVGVGYNGFPRGCSDDEIPWGRDGDWVNTKYPYVCHAELNAILNANGNLKGCTLYVDLFPCSCTWTSFPATSAPRQSSRRGFPESSIFRTNTRTPIPPKPPNGCSMRQESSIPISRSSIRTSPWISRKVEDKCDRCPRGHLPQRRNGFLTSAVPSSRPK